MIESDKRVIALGFFDGVHIGHAALLRRTAELAKKLDVCPCALTFDGHPESLITRHTVPLLNTVTERAEMMRNLYGIDNVIFAHFDNALMQMDWKSFIRDMVVKRFGAVHVVVGYDFHFGYKGQGNPALLKALCEELQIGCDVVERVEIDGIKVSSTYIRKLVAQGDMERAEMFLGHGHFMSGVVVRGSRLGSEIGAPTINFTISEPVLHPLYGVYASCVNIDGTDYKAVTNVGVRPTVAINGEVMAETTILGFSGDLYGRTVWVEYKRFLRPEEKFVTIDELKNQIEADIKEARHVHKRLS